MLETADKIKVMGDLIPTSINHVGRHSILYYIWCYLYQIVEKEYVSVSHLINDALVKEFTIRNHKE